MGRKWEYLVTKPGPPSNADSPVMDYRQMTEWLNDMGESGWDFIGYGQKHWGGQSPFTQDWWVFRRRRAGT